MNIAVYCGSGTGNNPDYIKAAKELGNWIGRNGHSMIYGGSNDGLMGITAEAARFYGVEVYGVVPFDIEFIKNRPQPHATKMFVEKDMPGRKTKMLELADVYVALPGGMGTLDEITEAMNLVKLGVYDKKCIMINTNGFYDPFREMIDRMIEAEFMWDTIIKNILFSDNLEEIEKFICE